MALGKLCSSTAITLHHCTLRGQHSHDFSVGRLQTCVGRSPSSHRIQNVKLLQGVWQIYPFFVACMFGTCRCAARLHRGPYWQLLSSFESHSCLDASKSWIRSGPLSALIDHHQDYLGFRLRRNWFWSFYSQYSSLEANLRPVLIVVRSGSLSEMETMSLLCSVQAFDTLDGNKLTRLLLHRR